MCLNTTFSWIAARPEGKQDRDLFYRFRVDDIQDMYNYVCVIKVVQWVFSILVFIAPNGDEKLTVFLFSTLLIVMQVSCWVIGRKYKTALVWLLHILFVLEGIVIVLEGTLTSDPEADVNAIMSQSQFSRVGVNSILFSLFLAPNFLSVFFYQLAMVAIVIFSAVMNDATDKDTVKENIMFPRHIP